MKTFPLCALAWLLAAGSVAPAALAARDAQVPRDAQALRIASLAATCAACHGTSGRGVPGSRVAPLAGVPAELFIAQMQAFKRGERPATVMHRHARGYTDEQIALMAAYFAAQPAVLPR
jgi:cytochrome c553